VTGGRRKLQGAVLVTKYYQDGKIKEDEKDRKCRAHGMDRNSILYIILAG
jgi:hypothetical protein